MDAFTMGGQLFAGPQFEAYDAWSEKYGGGLVVKVYKRSCMASAEYLLQAAIRQAPQAQNSTRSMTLIDVVLQSLTQLELDDKLAVNFIFRKKKGVIPEEELSRDEFTGQESRPLAEYGPLQPVLGQNKELFIGRDVFVKSQKFIYVNDANGFLREAFVQASVAHERNCRILDIYVVKENPKNAAFKLQLVLEKMSMDVSQNIEERLNGRQLYTERELLEFLHDVTEGLLHAKKLVSPSKHIAHCDIKPANIFVTNGRYKVGDFGSAWTKVLSTLTVAMQVGTPAYMSPELKKANPTDTVDLFASDVYSLGMTLLHMATLIKPKGEAIQRLGYSNNFKELLSGMIEDDFGLRLHLSQVMAKCKAQLVQCPPEEKNVEERKQPVEEMKQQEEIKQTPSTTESKALAKTPSGVTSSKSTAAEESKAAPVSPQAHTQGILFRLAFGREWKRDGLQVFDIDSRTWASPQRPILQMEADYATCYTFATETAVILCGSKLHLGHKLRACHAAGTSVYRVEFAGSPPVVTALPSLPERRVLAGLYVQEKIFLTFGG